MFRVIGGVVVYGFALYGAVKFFDRQRWVVFETDEGSTSPDRPLNDVSAASVEGEQVVAQ
jgi:hypothetical protein